MPNYLQTTKDGLPMGADLGPDEPVVTSASLPPKSKPRPKLRDLTKIEPDDATAPVKSKRKYAKGGYVRCADGIAQRGKTRGKMV